MNIIGSKKYFDLLSSDIIFNQKIPMNMVFGKKLHEAVLEIGGAKAISRARPFLVENHGA